MGLLARAAIITFSLLYFMLSLAAINDSGPSASISGYAVHEKYSGFAQPIQQYAINADGFTFTGTDDEQSMVITTSDFAVYRYAYVSLDGSDWIRTELSGKNLGGDWLNGSVSAQIPLNADDFGLSQSKLSTQRNYVVVYSCSRTGGVWDCHMGWQILQFDATLAKESDNSLEITAVSASGYVTSYVPGLSIDGNLSQASMWSDDENGAWTRYTLSGIQNVTQVNISFYRGDQRKAYFRIDTSLDGSSWTSVYDGESGGTTNYFETFDVTDTEARYVRITGEGNEENDYVSIVEVSIIGGDIPPCIPDSAQDTCGSWVCGSRINNCGQTVPCGTCADGKECASGTCVDEQPPPDDYDIRGKIMDAVGLVHNQEFLIPENSVNGDTVGQLNRMWLDYFGQHVTYSIVGGNDNNAFSIDNSGVLSVSNAGQLDYSSKSEYHLVVRATETSTQETTDATITVKLTDCTTPDMTVFINPDCQQDEGCCGQGTRADVRANPMLLKAALRIKFSCLPP